MNPKADAQADEEIFSGGMKKSEPSEAGLSHLIRHKAAVTLLTLCLFLIVAMDSGSISEV